MAMIVVNFFHSEWASATGINGDTAHKTKTELDANLRLFYTDDTATNYEKLRTMYQTAHQNDGFNALRAAATSKSWPAAWAMIPNQQNFNLNHLLGLPNRAS